MAKKTRLSRRTFLRAAGVSVALPMLEAMERPLLAAEIAQSPARMAYIYVPNGVNILNWLPAETGADYQLSPTLKTLEKFRDDFSLLSGLSHPSAKGGHSGADSWLSGVDLGGTPGYDYKNEISVDQVAAESVGLLTRIPSLELSSHGGTGQPGHSQTLSFNRTGIPLPSERSPRTVFDRLFADDSQMTKQAKKLRIEEDKSILDVVLSQAKSLNRQLGTRDRQKMDEYLTAVREVESRVQRSEKWLNVPKPKVDRRPLSLDVMPNFAGGSQHYYRVMFDLIFLAFKTDTTRICTFQLAREAHGGFLRLGSSNVNHHELSHHGGDADMLNSLYEIDLFYLQQLAYFLAKLKEAKEGEHSLLDRTMIVYGSGMNSGQGGGHSGENLPTLMAGGTSLGFKQGKHHAFDGKVPLTNLFVSMLRGMQLPVDAFGDSVGTLTGIS